MRKFAPILIIILAALVRLPGLFQPFWYDEAYTALLTKLPFLQMIAATVGDVHPPTWYIIERAFTALLGVSEWSLRLPSALLGTASVALAWRLARSLLDERAALVAAALMAVAPFEVYYSNEARMYALMTFASLLACIGIVEGKRAATVGGVAALLLSHNLGVIYLPVLALLSLWRCGWKRTLINLGAGSAAWAAWLPAMLEQVKSVGEWTGVGFWISDITGNRLVSFVSSLNQLLWPPFTPDWIAPVNVAATVALIVLPIIEAVRRRNKSALTLVALAFGPPFTLLAITFLWQPMMLARTLAGALPAWLALIAWWLTLKRKWTLPRSALVGAPVAALCATVLSFWFSGDRSDGLVAATRWMRMLVQPGQTVCHSDNSLVVMTRFYLGGNVAVIDLAQSNIRHSLSDATTRAAGIQSVPPEQCDWLIHVNSPLMSDDVNQAIDALLVERHATRELTIFTSQAANAALWKLNAGIASACGLSSSFSPCSTAP